MKKHRTRKIKLNMIQSAIMQCYQDLGMDYMLLDLLHIITYEIKMSDRNEVLSLFFDELTGLIDDGWIEIVEMDRRTENRKTLTDSSAMVAMRSDAVLIEWNEQASCWQMNSKYDKGNVLHWYAITQAGKNAIYWDDLNT